MALNKTRSVNHEKQKANVNIVSNSSVYTKDPILSNTMSINVPMKDSNALDHANSDLIRQTIIVNAKIGISNTINTQIRYS